MDPKNNPTPTPTPAGAPAPKPATAPAAGPTLETGPAAAISPESAFEGNVTIAGQESKPAATSTPAPKVPDFAAPTNTSATPSFGATEPLTEPDPTPVEDPAEAALKEPVKAAEPVPGSIGSAVSMPTDSPAAAPTPAPATSEPAGNPFPPVAAPEKKKTSKTTIYLLIVLGILIAAALAVYLFMQLGGNNQQANNQQNPTPVVPEEQEKPEEPEEPEVVKYSMLACKYLYDESELLALANATGGVKTLSAEYENDEMNSIILGENLDYADSSSATAGKDKLRKDWVDSFQELGFETDPFTSSYDSDDSRAEVTHSALVSEIDEDNMSLFNIALAKDKSIDFSAKSLKKTYEGLGYDCEIIEHENVEEPEE